MNRLCPYLGIFLLRWKPRLTSDNLLPLLPVFIHRIPQSSTSGPTSYPLYLQNINLTSNRGRPYPTMRLSLNLLLIVGSAAVARAALVPVPGASEELCGRLGVMYYDPDNLPEGVEVHEIRKCAGHPMGRENYWGLGDYLPRSFP